MQDLVPVSAVQDQVGRASVCRRLVTKTLPSKNFKKSVTDGPISVTMQDLTHKNSNSDTDIYETIR